MYFKLIMPYNTSRRLSNSPKSQEVTTDFKIFLCFNLVGVMVAHYFDSYRSGVRFLIRIKIFLLKY